MRIGTSYESSNVSQLMLLAVRREITKALFSYERRLCQNMSSLCLSTEECVGSWVSWHANFTGSDVTIDFLLLENRCTVL